MKVLIRRAKEEREARKVNPCRILEDAPDNGLLVPGLVEVAYRVYRARESVLFGVSKLLDVIPVQRCRYNRFSFAFSNSISHFSLVVSLDWKYVLEISEVLSCVAKVNVLLGE